MVEQRYQRVLVAGGKEQASQGICGAGVQDRRGGGRDAIWNQVLKLFEQKL